MLITVEKKAITEASHQRDFRRWQRGLTAAQLAAIYDKLNRVADSKDVHTSNWTPGRDWTGTVYQPIYEDACGGDWHEARLFFGLLMMQLFIDRKDT